MKYLRQWFAPPPLDTAEISIHAIGIQEPMRPCTVNRPGGTGDYLFMFFYDAVYIGVAGTRRRYPPNTFIIWDPRHGHDYGDPATAWMHSWLHCDGRAVGAMLADSRLPMNVPFALSDPAVVEQYLHDLYRETVEFAAPDAVMVRNLLENWVRAVRRMLSGVPGQRIPPRMLAVKQYLGAHYADPITLSDLAAQAHLSIPHFCSEFKRAFGLPAITYLTHLRLQQAAYLLRDQHLSITEIARLVGYHDLYHFSKQFKQHFHLSPRALRQQAHGAR